MKIILIIICFLLLSNIGFSQQNTDTGVLKQYYKNHLKGEKDPVIKFVRNLFDDYFVGNYIDRNVAGADILNKLDDIIQSSASGGITMDRPTSATLEKTRSPDFTLYSFSSRAFSSEI